MQYYQVQFIINLDGTVTKKVIASGPNCTAVTNELESAIGEVISQEMKNNITRRTQSMSHLTHIKTTIKNRIVLEKILGEMINDGLNGILTEAYLNTIALFTTRLAIAR